MKGKWRRGIGMRRRKLKPRFAIIGEAEGTAKQALSVVMQDSAPQKQLLLFLNRKVVDRAALDVVYKGGLTTLMHLGLVAGKKGGKTFFITPAETIVLRELGQSYNGL